MFGWRKKKEKGEGEMTVDEKEIEKAKKDIAEKGEDSQTERDRIDESVAAQERESGNENSQTAKDRIDESEGAEKADKEREERNEAHEERHEERAEDIKELIRSAVAEAVKDAVVPMIASEVQKAFGERDRSATEASEAEAKELSKIEKIYN